jgi:hypothetical protein
VERYIVDSLHDPKGGKGREGKGREGKVILEFIGWWSQLGGEFVLVPNVFPRGSSRIDFNEVLTYYNAIKRGY